MIYSPQQILRHLQIYLPQATNLFTDETPVSAEIIAGTPQVLRIIYPSHGYSADESISLANGLLDNGISTVTTFVDPNGNAGLRFTTNKPHDLTIGYEDNLNDSQIELRYFTDSGLNGFFDIYDIPNSTTFEILSNIVPALNGNEVLRENREIGVNNIFIIKAVSTDTIDIELTGLPEYDIKPVYGLTVIDLYRMGIVADWTRAQEIYTKQDTNDLWLFVIMEDVITSKDRRIESDAVAANTAQNDQRIKNIGTFSINVVFPTKESLSAAQAVQLAYETVYPIILKVMAGVPLLTLDQSNYITTMTSHGAVVSNRAYYAHNYSFELLYESTIEDTFLSNYKKTVAFRRINISYADKQDGSYLLLQ